MTQATSCVSLVDRRLSTVEKKARICAEQAANHASIDDPQYIEEVVAMFLEGECEAIKEVERRNRFGK